MRSIEQRVSCVCVCVCVCVCAFSLAGACFLNVRACVRACVHARARERELPTTHIHNPSQRMSRPSILSSQCVAVCCSVLQCVAVCCSVLQCDAVCCSVMQCNVV